MSKRPRARRARGGQACPQCTVHRKTSTVGMYAKPVLCWALLGLPESDAETPLLGALTISSAAAVVVVESVTAGPEHRKDSCSQVICSGEKRSLGLLIVA